MRKYYKYTFKKCVYEIGFYKPFWYLQNVLMKWSGQTTACVRHVKILRLRQANVTTSHQAAYAQKDIFTTVEMKHAKREMNAIPALSMESYMRYSWTLIEHIWSTFHNQLPKGAFSILNLEYYKTYRSHFFILWFNGLNIQ